MPRNVRTRSKSRSKSRTRSRSRPRSRVRSRSRPRTRVSTRNESSKLTPIIRSEMLKQYTINTRLTELQGVADSLGIPFAGLPKERLVLKINEKLAAR